MKFKTNQEVSIKLDNSDDWVLSKIIKVEKREELVVFENPINKKQQTRQISNTYFFLELFNNQKTKLYIFKEHLENFVKAKQLEEEIIKKQNKLDKIFIK